ncbi:hypothetical protein GDO81_028738 [Engystomops pustulosus]|uniref:Uncharacterized protein n=1 Tax=Engystomops pustulosus TaxID=76066 RepID=A0AAV6ZM44_ENGPU|nr:hypothetical protein GDO81_028738 [Engystomops pustulosus]
MSRPSVSNKYHIIRDLRLPSISRSSISDKYGLETPLISSSSIEHQYGTETLTISKSSV